MLYFVLLGLGISLLSIILAFALRIHRRRRRERDEAARRERVAKLKRLLETPPNRKVRHVEIRIAPSLGSENIGAHPNRRPPESERAERAKASEA